MKQWMVGLGFQVVIFLASAVFFQWDCLEYSLVCQGLLYMLAMGFSFDSSLMRDGTGSNGVQQRGCSIF